MRIKNWERFQHYKDRKPPWIKLHRSLIDDVEFHSLSGTAAKSLILLWIIASDDGGNLPSVSTMAFRLHMAEIPTAAVIGELVAAGFIEDGEIPAENSDPWPTRYIAEKVKAAVFERDSGICVWCKSPDNVEYDHIVPVSKGGTGTEGNVQLLCRACNRKKRTRTGDAAEQVATRGKELRSLETETETETEGEGEERARPRDQVQEDKDREAMIPPHPLVALCVELWPEWPQDQIEQSVMAWGSAKLKVTPEILRAAKAYQNPREPYSKIHGCIARQAQFAARDGERDAAHTVGRPQPEYKPTPEEPEETDEEQKARVAERDRIIGESEYGKNRKKAGGGE